MLDVRFMHEWLVNSPAHVSTVKTQKRIYVGGAVPDDSVGVGKRPSDVSLSMFSNPTKIFARINQELTAVAANCTALSGFLAHLSVHTR